MADVRNKDTLGCHQHDCTRAGRDLVHADLTPRDVDPVEACIAIQQRCPHPSRGVQDRSEATTSHRSTPDSDDRLFTSASTLNTQVYPCPQSNDSVTSPRFSDVDLQNKYETDHESSLKLRHSSDDYVVYYSGSTDSSDSEETGGPDSFLPDTPSSSDCPDFIQDDLSGSQFTCTVPPSRVDVMQCGRLEVAAVESSMTSSAEESTSLAALTSPVVSHVNERVNDNVVSSSQEVDPLQQCRHGDSHPTDNKNKSKDEEDEETHSQPDKNELQNALRTLNAKLEDLSTCNDLITKHGAALQKALSEFEQIDTQADSNTKVKSVNERATLFRITSIAMVKACHDYLELAQTQGRRWQRMLQHEHDQRIRLEEMVEQLAKQHNSIEKQARKSLAHVSASIHNTGSTEGPLGSGLSEEEDDFFDAIDETTEEFQVCLPPARSHKRTGSGISVDSLGANLGPTADNYDSSDTDSETKEAKVITHKSGVKKRPSSQDKMRQDNTSVDTVAVMSKRTRRNTIPERPNYSLNLWSIMKNCIGKELSKIPMPVNFSEPISFLQRLTEDFEYSECLDKGAACTDSCEQLAYVAAFTISSYANTTGRTGKPFNPLLGETFECDRTDDFGWRSFAEQVSHHPPMVAMFTEGRGWESWQEFTMSSKFRGKYLQIIPLGIAHLLFPKTGNHYTWRKVTTTVHNIIVGKLWVDNHGEMDIRNHHNGDNCHLKYSAYSYFSRETPRKVTGVITDSGGTARWVLQGTWDERIEAAKVIKTVETSKGKIVYETGDTKVLWQRRFPPADLEKCYNFTSLAVQLNEITDFERNSTAPTDSRLRPDQRLMEEGKWDEANNVKVQLEEKQRSVRRKREQDSADAASNGMELQGYSPKWFRKEKDPHTGNLIHVYTREYWEARQKKEWSRCPDIYIS